MPSKKLVLTFPPRLVREPAMYWLVKEYDLMVNIIRASITPDETGHLVVEIEGTPEQLEAGQGYLEKLGVLSEPLSSDIRWSEEKCVHCTACITTCPSGALQLDRESMRVSFDSDKCIGCELCIPVCGYGAIEIHF